MPYNAPSRIEPELAKAQFAVTVIDHELPDPLLSEITQKKIKTSVAVSGQNLREIIFP
jgi:hypothetical protein